MEQILDKSIVIWFGFISAAVRWRSGKRPPSNLATLIQMLSSRTLLNTALRTNQ